MHRLSCKKRPFDLNVTEMNIPKCHKLKLSCFTYFLVMSVWCIVFFEIDKYMRVCFNPQLNFRRLVSTINSSFLDGPIQSVREIKYYCPYITLMAASPDGTCLYYWDHEENDLDVTCMFSAHSREVSRGVEDPLI